MKSIGPKILMLWGMLWGGHSVILAQTMEPEFGKWVAYATTGLTGDLSHNDDLHHRQSEKGLGYFLGFGANYHPLGRLGLKGEYRTILFKVDDRLLEKWQTEDNPEYTWQVETGNWLFTGLFYGLNLRLYTDPKAKIRPEFYYCAGIIRSKAPWQSHQGNDSSGVVIRMYQQEAYTHSMGFISGFHLPVALSRSWELGLDVGLTGTRAYFRRVPYSINGTTSERNFREIVYTGGATTLTARYRF